MMRKLTIEIEPDERVLEDQREIFARIESYEILKTLKIDYREGICIDLIEFTLKAGVTIDDIRTIGNMEVLSVIGSEANRCTCLIKYVEPAETLDNFAQSDLDLIHSTPTIIAEDRITITVIGEHEKLKQFIDMIRTRVGTIAALSFTTAAYLKEDLLSVLTAKQREIMIAAHKYGYYAYPKRISSEQLAGKVQLSRSTLLQHLRKAEGRILDEIMAGYS